MTEIKRGERYQYGGREVEVRDIREVITKVVDGIPVRTLIIEFNTKTDGGLVTNHDIKEEKYGEFAEKIDE